MDKRVLWLDREDEDLQKRIASRTEKMLKLGLLDETQNLLGRGIEKNVSAANAIGYRECIAYLKGRLTFDDLIKQINQSTRRLVSSKENGLENTLEGRQDSWSKKIRRLIQINGNG